MATQIIQWNCRGYRTRYGDIRHLLQQHQPISALLQETMLGSITPTPPQNYSIETFSPSDDPIPGSGLAIVVRKDTGYRRLRLLSPLQAMAVRINVDHSLLTLCNIYVSPREPLLYQDLIDLIEELPRPFLIGGDLNSIHTMWGNDTRNQHGNIVERLLVNGEVCLLNTGDATHFHVQSGATSAIDLSLCSPTLLPDMQWMVLDDLHGSDHFPIVMKIMRPAPQPCEPRLLLKRADWITYEALTSMDDADLSSTVDDMTELLTQTLLIAASVAIPRSKGGTMEHKVPWWTDACTVSNHERKTALRRYQRTRSEVDKVAYKRARARAQLTKNTARKESWRKYISSINKDTPFTKIWQRIRKMRGKQQHCVPCLTVGGVTSAAPVTVADLLAEHFAEVSSGSHWSPHFQAVKNNQEQIPLDFTTDRPLAYNEPISTTEIYQALIHCKNTAPGPDGIHYKMIKRMHSSAVRYLVSLFNKIWTDHELPRQWKTATVLAFPKPGKPPSEPSSYRPIALSSCIGKLLEKIANGRLVRHLEANDLITPEQYGFRRNRGTVDALVRLQNHMQDSRRKGEHTICIFFDMHKAYDTTWRRGILQSLYGKGIRGNLALYCREFLRERFFRVRCGNSLSQMKEQNEGVPQGSVLSCTLFLLALDGITADIPNEVNASLYVDDLMLFASSRFLPALTRRMQAAVTRSENWAIEHGFVFSAQKTVALHVTPRRTREADPPLLLGGAHVNFRDEVKFLGMTLDKNLTWLPHLLALKARTMRGLDLLKCLAGLSWGADRFCLLTLYRSLIRSKIDYGCIVYQAATETNLSRLNSVHHSAIRLCTGAFRSSPVASLYAESGEPSLLLRRAQLSLQYLARLKQLPRSHTWNSVYGRRRDGGMLPFSLPSSFDYETMITETDLQPFRILPAQYNDAPIWRIPADTFCPLCSYPTKCANNSQALKHLFLEHAAEKHSDSLHIYTDGSKTDDDVGCAAVSRDLVSYGKLLPETSVFSSELYAIKLALGIVERSPHELFTIFTDSLSALQAVRSCDCRHPLICQIVEKISLLQHKRVCICWVPGHVDVRGNDEADRRAKQSASSNTRYINMGVPCRDVYPSIRVALTISWQRIWRETTENKLRDIKPTVRPWSSSLCKDRRMEVVLCRLRIGHSLLTHGFLMERGPPPYCVDCLVPLTVKHIIAECPSFLAERRARFPGLQNRDPTQILRDILAESPDKRYDHRPLRQFLQNCDLLAKL